MFCVLTKPADDPLCDACAHSVSKHDKRTGLCWQHIDFDEDMFGCHCGECTCGHPLELHEGGVKGGKCPGQEWPNAKPCEGDCFLVEDKSYYA